MFCLLCVCALCVWRSDSGLPRPGWLQASSGGTEPGSSAGTSVSGCRAIPQACPIRTAVPQSLLPSSCSVQCLPWAWPFFTVHWLCFWKHSRLCLVPSLECQNLEWVSWVFSGLLALSYPQEPLQASRWLGEQSSCCPVRAEGRDPECRASRQSPAAARATALTTLPLR